MLPIPNFRCYSNKRILQIINSFASYTLSKKSLRKKSSKAILTYSILQIKLRKQIDSNEACPILNIIQIIERLAINIMPNEQDSMETANEQILFEGIFNKYLK